MWAKHRALFLVTLSALLYATAFLLPQYCWWCVGIFLLPIWYGVHMHEPLGFWLGFVWGLIFFGIHSCAYLVVIYEYFENKWWCLGWVALVFWCALHAALWFWATSYVERSCKYNWQRIGAWLISTPVFFWWVWRCILWPLGILEGYPFVMPSLPLATHAHALSGVLGMGHVPVLWSMEIIALMLMRISWKSALVVFGMALFVVEYSEVYCVQKPEIAGLFAWCNLKKACSPYPLERAQELLQAMEDAIERQPEATVLVLSESAFPFPLNEYPEVVSLWCDNLLDNEDKILLVGAQRREQNELYNTVYVISQRRIMQSYDKYHLVPVVERQPTYFLKLIGKQTYHFQRGDHSARSLIMPGKGEFKLCICSELFCTTDYHTTKTPILCVANESWFSCRYQKHLMQLSARLIACQNNQAVMYASHDGMHTYIKE